MEVVVRHAILGSKHVEPLHRTLRAAWWQTQESRHFLMKRVIGLLAAILIFSLPARRANFSPEVIRGNGSSAPAHAPERFHGTPDMEPIRDFSDLRLGT
jgi:hypothetical protein